MCKAMGREGTQKRNKPSQVLILSPLHASAQNGHKRENPEGGDGREVVGGGGHWLSELSEIPQIQELFNQPAKLHRMSYHFRVNLISWLQSEAA